MIKPMPPLSLPTEPSQPSTQPPAVPHIEATFTGDYYRGVAGAMEVEPFEKTVKVPLTWLHKSEISPVAVFKHKFEKKILGAYPGFNAARTVTLTATTDLPSGLTVEQELAWTADFSRLVLLAKRFTSNVGFIPLDPKEGTPMPAQRVTVQPELYPDCSALRNAIRRCMAEPQAFKAEQEKLSKGYQKKVDEMTMQEELDALYPDGF